MKRIIAILFTCLVTLFSSVLAESALPNIQEQRDSLQSLFLSLNSKTTPDEFEAMIELSGLPYAKSEFNKSGNGKQLSYVVAFTDGAAAFKYAESGDQLEVSFDLGNHDELMFAEYSKSETAKSALYYRNGTWWSFSNQNAFDYSGYYYIDRMAKDTGITIQYKNGHETATNYVLCENGEQAIDMVTK